MKARALSTFITICLFIVASLVSTLGVFVPSAAASDDFPPVVPVLVSPIDGGAVDTTEPVLEWTYESEATRYAVQVATDTTFVEPLISEAVEGATSYQVPADAGLEVGNTYYWRVAVAPEGDELPSWSTTSSFKVEDTEELPDVPDVPAAPCLLSPLDEASIGYEDIKNDLESAWLIFTSEEGVQTSHIKISGEFLKDGMVTSLDLDMIISGDSFSMTELASDDSEFPQLIAGDTYTWAVRSSFVEDASKDSEEVWGEWSDDDWTFTVVAKEPENDEPIDEGDTDEEDIAPKTTTTITTTRVEHVVTVVTTSYTYPNPQFVYEGPGVSTGGSAPVDRSISSTSTENIIENEEPSEPVEDSGAFLFLGWWWIVVVATVAGAYYLFFRVPAE